MMLLFLLLLLFVVNCLLLFSVVATPGRFLHLLMEMELKLSSVEYVVFDEADRLFEMGFSEQLKEILKKLPEMRYRQCYTVCGIQ